jgi:hypothetical protein
MAAAKIKYREPAVTQMDRLLLVMPFTKIIRAAMDEGVGHASQTFPRALAYKSGNTAHQISQFLVSLRKYRH